MRQLAWFFGIWAMSVLTLGIVSFVIRAILKD
ncbi:MAG TPA: DUF2474 family protein [Aestuariivirga sp.]